jgi:hypothetical protein
MTQVIAAGGSVALWEARQLERDVLDAIRQGCTGVVIDLRGVTGIGPGLLGVLLRIRRGVTRVGGQVALLVDGPPVSDRGLAGGDSISSGRVPGPPPGACLRTGRAGAADAASPACRRAAPRAGPSVPPP